MDEDNGKQEITSSKQRQDYRRQSDRDIADFFANANIGMHWVGPDGIILWANQYEMDLLGYRPEEYIGHHIKEFHADKNHIEDIHNRLRTDERVDDEEVRLLAKDGTIKYGLISSSVFWEDGQFIHTRCFTRDITDRKKIEEAFRLKERELRSITDTVPSLLAFIDKGHRYRFNNQAYHTWFGESPELIYGKHIRDVAGEETYQSIRPYLEQALAGQPSRYEIKVRLKNSGERFVSGTYTPHYNDGGEIEGVVSNVHDITEHRLAELKVQESEQRFRALADTTPVMIWTANVSKERDYFNKTWLEFTGKTLEQEQGFQWISNIHPDDQKNFIDTYHKFFNARQPFKIEYRLRHHDGQYCWVLSHAVPRFTRDNKFIGYLGSVVEIHDRKEFEERLGFLAKVGSILFESLDYETTLQNLANFIVPNFADWCTVTLFENHRQKSTTIAHKDSEKVQWAHEINKRFPADLYAPYGTGKVLRTGQSEIYPEVTDGQLRQTAHSPEHLEILRKLNMSSAMLVPIKSPSKTLGVIEFITTESHHKYTRQDLVFAEELARNAAVAIENAQLYKKIQESDNAKTQFLSMLAHELRNPMAPILSSLELMQFQAEHDPAMRETTGVMTRQVKQMSRLLDDLLDVSRIIHGKIKLNKNDVDLNTIATYAIETTRPLKEEFKHTLSVSLPSRPLEIYADSVRLEQIIVNLLNNAYKYTKPGGTVWLTITQQNNQAVIRVKDNGIGIASTMMPKIFELFGQADNSLDRSYGGMGIGLTLVKSLVEMHNGTIEVQSAGLGQGSEFIVRFPANTPVPQVDAQATLGFADENQTDHQPVKMKNTHRILIVDDNRDAANALGRLLERLGHNIQIAYNGTTAIEMARSYQPDVILLDIGLPEMSGYEVANQLRKENILKDTMLVAVTGYGQEEDKLRSQEAGFDYHFTKPIGIDVLSKILN